MTDPYFCSTKNTQMLLSTIIVFLYSNKKCIITHGVIVSSLHYNIIKNVWTKLRINYNDRNIKTIFYTAWHTKILMTFLASQTICFRMLILYVKNCVYNFEIIYSKHAQFWFEVQFLLKNYHFTLLNLYCLKNKY